MHLAYVDRQGRCCGLSPQSAPGLVLETAGRHRQRRLRGHLRAERAATQPAGAARKRLFGGISLPRSASDHAYQADRHRAVQIRRIQARGIDPSGAQSRLLEKDRPYLDEITFRMIDSRATRMLAFATGDFDITFPSDVSVPLIKDMKARAPKAICEMITTGTQINLMVNRVNPPFDNPNIRKAMSLAIDRKAFNTILMEGLGLMGGAMLPQPVGEWGMPPEIVMSLTGYGPDSDKNIAEAQAIMQKLGYNDANPLQIKIQTRNLPTYRDPAVILTDQLKKIHIVGELDILDTPRWYAKLAKKDYTIGLNVTGVSVDDPDGNIVENYSCKSERNYTQYCNAEVDGLLAAQSRELDKEKRRKIVWDIERLLVDDAARPIIISSVAANCWQPYVRNYTPHDNSQYNSLRFEEVWLDK